MASAAERGFFAGLDVFAGTAEGSSSTVDGGAPFAGGGVVGNVRLGKTAGAGGHVGYRLGTATSAFLSYQHIEGDIDWKVNFPMFGVSSAYEGSATSDAIMGNLAYEFPLSEATSVRASAGLGVTFNALSGVVETDRATGIFLANVASHRKVGPAAQIGAGIRYKVTPSVALGLEALLAYSGKFETGKTRSGNLGITDINPYEIKDVWRANLGASISFEF